MRWPATLAVAALAETLAYFLSLTWGFMALLLAFTVVSTRMATTAAKAYTTETRVNAIIPVLATHAANITAAQNTANGAQSTANTANAAANNAQGTANNANNTANNALPIGGGTITGNLTINGQIGIHGGGTNIGQWTTDSLNVNGTGTIGSTLGVNGALYVVGNSSLEATVSIGGTCGISGPLYVVGHSSLEGGYS